jgi:putative DNA-invertase from lambdoid prophage Rac
MFDGPPTRAAIWCRISQTDDQTTDNQLLALRRWAEQRGLEVVKEYIVEASAFTGAHRPHLKVALQDAHHGLYQVILVWALDRLSREGIEPTLAIMRQFRTSGVLVLSHQESWTDGPPAIQELLSAVMAWCAQQESQRKSERVKAGNARRAAQGLPLGRQPGAKDKKPRKRSGYFQRYGH